VGMFIILYNDRAPKEKWRPIHSLQTHKYSRRA